MSSISLKKKRKEKNREGVLLLIGIRILPHFFKAVTDLLF